MSQTLDDVDALLEGEWELWWNRTGREFPPNNRLVQVTDDEGRFKELYVSEDDYQELLDRENA